MNKPFFANFLEEQDVKEVSGGTYIGLPVGVAPGGGGCVITDPRKDQLEVTMKAPSDGDEGAELELF